MVVLHYRQEITVMEMFPLAALLTEPEMHAKVQVRAWGFDKKPLPLCLRWVSASDSSLSGLPGIIGL